MIMDQTKCLQDILGTNTDLEQFKNNPDYQEFQRKIQRIIVMGSQYDIAAGDMLIIIGKVFNLSWNSIPLSKFTEIEQWISHNWFRAFEIISPELHMNLMKQPNEYSNWYNSNLNQNTHKGFFYGNSEKDSD